MTQRDYSVNLNVNFMRPLRIEVSVILQNNVEQAQLAQQLRSASGELKEAVDQNQSSTP